VGLPQIAAVEGKELQICTVATRIFKKQSRRAYKGFFFQFVQWDVAAIPSP
jgi:hypothetical protein